MILVECKLTGSEYGKLTMDWLYVPLLKHLFGNLPVFCLQVCKNLAPNTPGPFVTGPEQFLDRGYEYATWHWMPDRR